jgi:CheY-like chemotaxis protein
VYGIVKQSGGNIEVQSTPGQGTSFTIHLPRSRSAVAAASRTAPPRSPGFIGTETILVVEDELAVRKLVERILRADGYTVLTAADGAEALQICDAHEGEIHLVLTDVVLPQMSGKAIAERLVRHRPQIRVLYMSGYSGEAIAQRGVLEAGVALLAKPFSPTALTSKVREVLDQEWPSSDGGAT